MDLYKVWNSGRNIKKCAVASSFEELIQKARKKLKVDESDANVRLVLESDGTEVDEETFEYISPEDHVFLILKQGESWTPLGTVVASATENLSATEASGFESRPTPPAVSYSEPVKPGRLELPDFSDSTKMLLQSTHLDQAMRSVIKEATAHFFHKYNMKTSDQYQVVSRQLVAKYPVLSREGARPWSFLSAKISSGIRQIRLKQARKSEDYSPNATPCKTVKIDKKPRSTPTTSDLLLNEDDLASKQAALVKEWEGDRRDSVVMELYTSMKYNFRRWIISSRDITLSNVLQTYPCFENGTYVMEEFRLFGKCNTIKDNAELLFYKVTKTMATKPKGSDFSKLVQQIRHLEKEVAIERGKGVRSKSCLKVISKESIDLEEHHLDTYLSTKKGSAPSLVVLADKDFDSFQEAFVVGDGSYIETRTTCVLDAVIFLMAVYYVFDLNYPGVYGQFLGFLQQSLMDEPFTSHKGTNFVMYSAKINAMTEINPV